MNINKFFQETKGVISLMLVLLLVPFYSVAAILVEVERYKSAVSGLDGAIDSSLMSILSEYDSFIIYRRLRITMMQCLPKPLSILVLTTHG